MKSVQKFSMKYVSRKTGLTPHTIRVWERRYNAVTPERSETNRRLYSESDVERLLLLRRATILGHSIGRIATLPMDDLMDLAEGDTQNDPQTRATSSAQQTESAEEIIKEAMEAVHSFDREGLEIALHRASASFSQPYLIEQVLAPFLRMLGELWSEGKVRAAQEHFASSVIRGFLASFGRQTSSSQSDPILLVATPAGQHHEFGALFVAIAASSYGWRTLYIGANLPAEEIAGAASANGARAVALSIIYPSDDPRVAEELSLLRRCLPEIPILVGGRSAASYQSTLDSIGAEILCDSSALGNCLNALRRPLAHQNL